MNIKLELSLDEVNIILGSLSKQPYETVYKLINTISETAREQLAPKEEVSDDK